MQTMKIEKLLSLICLFLICFCSLALEISLTRLYSVTYTHSYVYLIISLSMAGLGFGTVSLYYLRGEKLKRYFEIIVYLLPITLLLLLLSSSFYINILVSLALTLLLFVYVGSCSALLFIKSKVGVPILYAADLTGAAFGALSSYFLLNTFGGIKAIILLLVVILMSACLIYCHFFKVSIRVISFTSAVVISALTLLVFNVNSLVTPEKNPLKDMSIRFEDKTDNPRIVESRWSAFGRSDLLETDNPHFKTLYIDGSAGTKMVKMDSNSIDKDLSLMLQTQYVGGISFLPLPFEERNEALVIGGGGGIDVVTLLAGKFKKITAVEINPDFIEIVKEHKDYNGGIYNNHDKIKIVNDEGRNFVRRNNRKYNILMMSLPIIKSSRAHDSYALAENYLFTYEAFREYRDALKENGYLVVVAHYPNEAYRLLASCLKSFESQGVSLKQAMEHIVVIGNDSAPAFIMKKSPFTEKETQAFYKIVIRLSQQGETTFIPFIPQHQVPYRESQSKVITEKNFHNQEIFQISRGSLSLREFVSGKSENISWVSDDSPFFYQMEKMIPQEVLYVFIASLVACVGFCLSFVRKKTTKINIYKNYLFLFGLMGVGFILIEVYVLQKFILFWGHQTLALSCMLTLVLLATGFGSFVSNYIKNQTLKINLSLISIVLLSFIYLPFIDFVLFKYTNSDNLVKVIVSTITVFPLFFVMGIPFPTLLKSIHSSRFPQLFPWMMGMNSLATVLGGVSAIMIALLLGYKFVIITGAIFYFLILLVVSSFNPIRVIRKSNINVNN